MATFREFEQDSWEDVEVCATYGDRFGRVVAQAIGPVLDAVNVGPRDDLLDVATGSGAFAAAAAGLGATAVGVDFSGEQLRLARAAHPTASFEPGDAADLPFGPARFDVVVCNLGVPHFAEPETFFREAFRVLRPSGRFAFTVWAEPARTRAFAAIYGAIQRHGSLDVGLPPGPNFFLYADEDQSRTSLTAAGFVAVAVTTIAQTWTVRDADDVFTAILNGTVRAAAVLKRQPPDVLARIRQTVRAEIETYVDGECYRIPMPAVLTTATKPPAGPAGEG